LLVFAVESPTLEIFSFADRSRWTPGICRNFKLDKIRTQNTSQTLQFPRYLWVCEYQLIPNTHFSVPHIRENGLEISHWNFRATLHMALNLVSQLQQIKKSF
jgi:hypothetical protein